LQVADLVEENTWLCDRPTRVTHHYSDRMAEVAPERPPRRYNYVQYDRRPTGAAQLARQTTKPATRRLDGYRGHDVPDYDQQDEFLTIDGVPGEESSAAACADSTPVSPQPSPLDPGRLFEEAGGPPPSPTLSPREEAQKDEEARDWDGDDAIFAGPTSADDKSDLAMRCPLCLAKFLVEDHGELLKHIQNCCESA
jgi:hypothetical protein